MNFESSSFDASYKNEISSENMGDKIPLNNFGKSCLTYKVNLYGKWVVLKRIKPEYISNVIVEKAFDKEFEIGFTLDHPHIVKYLNKGNDKEENYIITEYIDGKTLREHLINGTPFSQKQIKNIFAQLLETAAYLHKKNIFHLDIKPENILISDKSGNIKLIDFGFSYSDGHIPISSGTRKYTSKESVLNPDKVNYKNDLYSIAIVIIELFFKTTEVNYANKLPFSFKRIVKLCLNKDNDFTTEDLLILLNKRKVNYLIYIIIGLISIFLLSLILNKDFESKENMPLEGHMKKSAWRALPTLPSGRADGKAIYFDGKIYYISGVGANGGLSTNDVFEYDISRKKYTSKKPINCARAQIGAVELNGKIYTFGGWIGNSGTDTSEVYNIKLNEWKYLKPLPKILTAISICVLNNKIYILGSTLGATNTYFYEYDPIKEEYKQKAVFNHSRSNSCLVNVGEKIYAIGGSSYKNDNYFIHNDCDVYDVNSDSWQQKTSFPIGISNGSAVVVDDEIHYIGGTLKSNSITDNDALRSDYIYNVSTDVWRNGEDLPCKIFGNECVSVGKIIYCFGGFETLPNAIGKSFSLDCTK